MIPYETSRFRWSDMAGAWDQTWRQHRGDVFTTSAMLLGLAAVMAVDASWLVVALAVAVLVNGARIFYRAAVSARETRDLNAYWDSLFVSRPAQWSVNASGTPDV